jgi:hypothetical protein
MAHLSSSSQILWESWHRTAQKDANTGKADRQLRARSSSYSTLSDFELGSFGLCCPHLSDRTLRWNAYQHIDTASYSEIELRSIVAQSGRQLLRSTHGGTIGRQNSLVSILSLQPFLSHTGSMQRKQILKNCALLSISWAREIRSNRPHPLVQYTVNCLGTPFIDLLSPIRPHNLMFLTIMVGLIRTPDFGVSLAQQAGILDQERLLLRLCFHTGISRLEVLGLAPSQLSSSAFRSAKHAMRRSQVQVQPKWVSRGLSSLMNQSS